MVKPLSAQLADLSVRAKNAEDAAAVAQKEAHDKLVARRDQAHATAHGRNPKNGSGTSSPPTIKWLRTGMR